MKKLILLFNICLLIFTFDAFSQSTESPIRAKFLVEGGIEYGGDEILKVFYTNGEDQSMKAGQGGYLSIGGEFQSTKLESFLLRTSIGIKYNTTAAENANIRLTRIPINVVGYWKISDDFRLGIGATSHQSVKLKGDGFVPDMDFKSSIGPRFEIGYKWIALTYTALNYKTETDNEVSANSVGLSVSFTLPNKKL